MLFDKYDAMVLKHGLICWTKARGLGICCYLLYHDDESPLMIMISPSCGIRPTIVQNAIMVRSQFEAGYFKAGLCQWAVLIAKLKRTVPDRLIYFQYQKAWVF